jgi:hypothetical protein
MSIGLNLLPRRHCAISRVHTHDPVPMGSFVPTVTLGAREPVPMVQFVPTTQGNLCLRLRCDGQPGPGYVPTAR